MKYTDQKVQVVTVNGTWEFLNLTEAKVRFPQLDPEKSTEFFTWGMNNGGEMRFEDWATNDLMSR